MSRTSKHYWKSKENTSVSPRRDVLRVSGDFGISIRIYLPGILSSAFVVVHQTGKTLHDPSRLVPCNFTRSRRGLSQSDTGRLKRQYTNLTTKTTVVLCRHVCVCHTSHTSSCVYVCLLFFLLKPFFIKTTLLSLFFIFYTHESTQIDNVWLTCLGISPVSSSTLRKFHPVYLISKKVENRRQSAGVVMICFSSRHRRVNSYNQRTITVIVTEPTWTAIDRPLA